MPRLNALLASIDILLAILIVFAANFLLKTVEPGGDFAPIGSENFILTPGQKLDQVKVLEEFPRTSRYDLNYVAIILGSGGYGLMDIERGSIVHEKYNLLGVESVFQWIAENRQRINELDKRLVVFEQAPNDRAVARIIRYAHDRELFVGYGGRMGAVSE